MRFIYLAGRAMQVIGLVTLPSAVWIVHFTRNEPAAIGVFVGSIAVFTAGFYLSKVYNKS